MQTVRTIRLEEALGNCSNEYYVLLLGLQLAAGKIARSKLLLARLSVMLEKRSLKPPPLRAYPQDASVGRYLTLAFGHWVYT